MKKKIVKSIEASLVLIFVAVLSLSCVKNKDNIKKAGDYSLKGTDISISSYKIKDEEYVIFDQFFDFLNPTSSRMGADVLVNENGELEPRLKDDLVNLIAERFYNERKSFKPFRKDDDVTEEEYKIAVNGKAHDFKAAVVKNIKFIKLSDLSDALKFKIEKGEIVFQKSDDKPLTKDNDRDYDWYIDQRYTGSAAMNNCGPSCAVMAMRYQNPSETLSVEKAREEIPKDNGWWYTDDLEDFFKKHKVNYRSSFYTEPDKLIKPLLESKIAILCINSEDIRYNRKPNEIFNKPYTGGGGHFIVVKGYRIIDGKMYFTVNDPNSWGDKNSNGEPVCKNRLYDAVDIDRSLRTWSTLFFIIDNK